MTHKTLEGPLAKHKSHRKSLSTRGTGAEPPSERLVGPLPFLASTSSTPQEHKKHAPHSVRCAVIPVSGAKPETTDRGGPTIRGALEKTGHAVAWSRVVRDEVLEIRAAVEAGLADAHVQAVLLTGGTGIARRDVTIEALA